MRLSETVGYLASLTASGERWSRYEPEAGCSRIADLRAGDRGGGQHQLHAGELLHTPADLRTFPTEPVSFAVAAFLTDGLGEIELEMELQSLDNMEQLLRLGRRFRFENPLAEYRCVFRVRNYSFPREATYQIVLLADKELVAQRVIILKRKEQS